jgi:hypothetical protein
VKRTFYVFALLFLLTIIAGSSKAQSNQDFSITNSTGMISIDVFISPDDANDWGSDVIPKDMILDGETFNFSFTGVAPDKCTWDIMFTAENGVKYYMQNVDLCNTVSITLTSH